VYVRVNDGSVALTALSGLLRRWDFVRKDVVLDDYQALSGHEVRALYRRDPAANEQWTTLAIEDLQNAMEIAYGLSKSMGDVPVIVSRAYQYGDWELKGYLGEECVLKVGDDPDHELAWVGPKLTTERIPKVVEKLGVDAALSVFLQEALGGHCRPDMFANALNLPSMRQGFSEIHGQSLPQWTFASWVHESSRYAA